MPGVTITGLTKHYGDVGAVKGLDLRVEPGWMSKAFRSFAGSVS